MLRNHPKANSWKILLTIFSLALIFSCRKDNAALNDAPIIHPDFVTKVTAGNISGFVTNENNQAVQGASVKIGTATVTTDEYGYFQAANVLVVKQAATVTVKQAGYFKGIKTFLAEEGKNAFFRIKLIPKTVAGTIDAAAGGQINTASGVKISFPTTAIVNAATNAAYTGSVHVSASWLDPTSPELNSIMPGDLRGIDENNSMKKLATYGMLAVELTGTSGELLQMAPGKKAGLTFPLPASLLGTAPTSIPLWSFDEEKGLWKQEGSATKTGNTYTGDVSHFSFWNCDVPANYVQFSCTLHNGNGLPLRNTLVKISVISNPQNAAWGYTDSLGYVAGAVPGNEQLKMEVFSSSNCATPLYSQNFTTTTVNISLGIIVVNPPAANMATVTGTVIDCSNNPVTNGYIIVTTPNGNYRYPLSAAGSYSFSYLLCSGPETVAITAENVAAGQQNSSPATAILSSGVNSIPAIQACGLTTQQFFNVTVNAVTTNYTAPADSLMNTPMGNGNAAYIMVSAFRNSPASLTNLGFSRDNITSTSSQQLLVFRSTLANDSMVIVTPAVVTMTEYGAIGQFLSGNFTASFIGPPPTNTAYAVSGSFRVRRSF